MKKFFLLTCLGALALLALPAAGEAAKAGDFDFGGFIKLETFWDSTQMGKSLQTAVMRRNAAQPNRVGRLRMTPQGTRPWFVIRGPEVFGAKTQGYIEFDFNADGDTRQSASNAFRPRMRHAWFRMDWPGGWQLLFGQYWGVFSNFYPECINDGPYMNHGHPTQRIPQVRLTYKTGPWRFSGLVGVNYDPAGDNVVGVYNTLIGSQAASVNTNAALWGQNSNFPQFQAEVAYEKDLWGKAAFRGRPRPFVVNVGGGVTSINYQGGSLAGAATWGGVPWRPVGAPGTGDQYTPIGLGTAASPRLVVNNQTLTPWVVQATMFIPILVTKTNNLKNTASLTVQFQIGQGQSFIGNGRDADNTWFRYDSPGNRWNPGAAWAGGAQAPITQELLYRRHLTKKYGGYIQGQYYLTNQWYVSYTYGFAKPYGVTRSRNGALASGPLGSGITGLDAANLDGYEYATVTDQTRMWQEHQINLFFSPIKAFLFGVGYSFMQTDYFQITSSSPVTFVAAGGVAPNFGAPTANSSYRATRTGQNHSIRFGAWFYY
jgi:hypothetical protein